MSKSTVRILVGDGADDVLERTGQSWNTFVGRCLAGDDGDVHKIEEEGNLSLLEEISDREEDWPMVWHAVTQMRDRGMSIGLYPTEGDQPLWVLHRPVKSKSNGRRKHRVKRYLTCVWTSADLMANIVHADKDEF